MKKALSFCVWFLIISTTHAQRIAPRLLATAENDSSSYFSKFLQGDSTVYIYTSTNKRPFVFNNSNWKLTNDTTVLAHYSWLYKYYYYAFRAFYQYDSHDNPILNTSQNYDTNTLVWTNSGQDYYVYDAGNNLVNTTVRNWDKVHSTWINYSQDFYTYDTKHNMLSDFAQLWDAGLGSFINQRKFCWAFDADTNIVADSFLYWDNSSGSWIPSQINAFSFDPYHNTITALFQGWNVAHAALFNYSRWTNTINASHEIISSKEDIYDSVGMVWQNYRQHFYTYDSRKNKLTDTIQIWNGSSYQNAQLGVFTYDAANNALTKTWKSLRASTWVDTENRVFSYDSLHDIISELEQYKDIASGLIQNYALTLTSYNSYGEPLTEHSYSLWDTSTNDWNSKTIFNYYYDKSVAVPANSNNLPNTIKIYPSPANDLVSLSIDNIKAQPFFITIYSTDGKLYRQWQTPAIANYHTEISVHNMPAGNYLLSVKCPEGVTTKQFAIIH
jgi:hypothetical protein